MKTLATTQPNDLITLATHSTSSVKLLSLSPSSLWGRHCIAGNNESREEVALFQWEMNEKKNTLLQSDSDYLSTQRRLCVSIMKQPIHECGGGRRGENLNRTKKTPDRRGISCTIWRCWWLWTFVFLWWSYSLEQSWREESLPEIWLCIRLPENKVTWPTPHHPAISQPSDLALFIGFVYWISSFFFFFEEAFSLSAPYWYLLFISAVVLIMALFEEMRLTHHAVLGRHQKKKIYE